jgi:3-phenylpropionate/trans-cinnamate dioxygenase ferredoxin subunit
MTEHTLCRADELRIGAKRAFSVGGRRIVLFHLDDGFYATQATCTHMFAPLARGRIVDDCEIQCPFHRARFDVRTGDVIDWASFPPGIGTLNFIRAEKSLKTYRVSIVRNEVRVALD